MMSMTHRHERNVERTIRLWIAQQERSQRKGGQLGRLKARGDVPAEQAQRGAIAPSTR